MAVELSARVESPVKLKMLLEELYIICKQLNLEFNHHLQIVQNGKPLDKEEIEILTIENNEVDFVIELQEIAKVTVDVFSAGDSEWLDEEGGFWIYFDIAELRSESSLVLALVLAIAYAKSAKTEVVDDVLILKEKRVLNTHDLIDKFKPKGSDNFVCYSTKLCQKLGVSF